MMIAVQVSAQPVIANVSQGNETGTQQCGGTLTIFTQQGVSGKSGKNQKGEAGKASKKNSFVFMLPASQ